MRFLIKHSAAAAVIWALVILLLCATPGQYIPTEDWMELFALDKWIHAGIFFVLMSLLLILSFKKNYSLTAIFTFLALSILYGGLLEVMQARLFSQRSADWRDFIANSAGCIIAVFCSGFIRKFSLAGS